MEEQHDDELMFEVSERSGNFVRRVVGQENQRRGNEAVGNYIAFLSTAAATSSRLPKQYRRHPLLAVSVRMQNLGAIALDQTQLYDT